ncbi:hypothetical protein [Aliiroseovarius zhejiangensis]|uniref:hypothetical protein n=1 Tax=Aliiroseovarius zhejiangensis TaxID=1632025 RepID=UPI00174C9754|nr:hypothetical protein [Aliiroseovarius zhejiangensis]
MTDNKAPERITAWINKDGSTQFAGDKLFPSNVEVEYVRADLRPVVKPLGLGQYGRRRL